MSECVLSRDHAFLPVCTCFELISDPCTHALHPEIQYKKPQVQDKLYQEGGFLYLISGCNARIALALGSPIRSKPPSKPGVLLLVLHWAFAEKGVHGMGVLRNGAFEQRGPRWQRRRASCSWRGWRGEGGIKGFPPRSQYNLPQSVPREQPFAFDFAAHERVCAGSNARRGMLLVLKGGMLLVLKGGMLLALKRVCSYRQVKALPHQRDLLQVAPQRQIN
eukprot:1039860-Rhodomonas_salina.1